MRKTSKTQSALEQAAEEQAALEEIANIRRNGFDPGDERVNKAIRTCGPVRALVLMRVAARAYRISASDAPAATNFSRTKGGEPVRKASKKQSAPEHTAEEQAALDGIANIRRNGFNPGDEPVNEAIRELGPVRALAVMRLAQLADRKFFSEVH